MATGTSTAASRSVAEHLAPSGSQRLFVTGGIALIVAGMIFGDIFAVFVLHQNGNRIGGRLIAAVHAVAARDTQAVTTAFHDVGGLLENRGTKVDAHVHMIDFGYLALLMALVQPYVSLAEERKRLLASLFLWGAVMLPVGVFSIHYVGLQYSPFSAIGWASVIADLGGSLVLVAMVLETAGLLRWFGGDRAAEGMPVISTSSWCARTLMTGGTLLVLAGFLHGAHYAITELYQAERADRQTLGRMVDAAAANQIAVAEAAVVRYGGLQAAKAIQIAAHSHVIEFGMLAMLLAFIQPYVKLSETWRRRWVISLLAGSVILPVCVLQELRFGLVAGGVADVGGALVIVALIGMLVGVIRHGGRLDAGVQA